MDLGEYSPKSTIQDVVSDAVPLGPSADSRGAGDAVVNSNGRNPSLEEFPDLASRSKNELSLDISSLT
jgi:hypothetical protein